VQHEISAADVLHHKVYPRFRLETTVKPKQERMALFCGGQKNAFLRSRAFNFIVIDDEFLFQDLHGEQLTRDLLLGEHDLSEVTFAQDR